MFAAIVALALPTTALASADQRPNATGSKREWYNGKSHHFQCTVQDADGTVLTEGEDFTRSYAFVTDRRNTDKIDASAWKDTDEGMTSSGFVWERITYIGDYAKWDEIGYHSYVRHDICTQYEFAEQNVTKVEGEEDPTLTATLKVLLGDPTTEISLSAFTLSREAGEKPGKYAITYTADPEQIPAAYTSNSAGTRTGLGEAKIGDYTNIVLVGDDICGFNYIKVVPGTLTIVPATTDVTVTVAWKDSSNKDGVRPSAEDFAKLLSLTADGEASDAEPTVVDNGNDTYTVTYKGVQKYAYTDDDERYEIAYQVTQASVADYTTDKATVDNGGTITNTHEAKVTPTPTPDDKTPTKPAAETTERKTNVPKTGDESVNTAAIVAVGAVVLSAAVVAKKRTEL
ncbi:MAG: Cna B-type domain-containing protein [Coriobacteriia bacterium]|nr:Cna B-type domain-containing protein [Coriobacteriia bacterium]